MKHIFIVNPASGKQDFTPELTEKLKAYDGKIDYEIYVTKGPMDAAKYVNERASTGEELRFYSCGGDGTFNEVVNGVFGHDNASVTVIPSGSGNDFVKYYGGADKFTLEALFDGTVERIDAMDVNGRKCINICNFGFDTTVAKTISKVKRKYPKLNAYTIGVVKALLTAMGTKCHVVADGKVVCDKKLLLCTIGNGAFVGGSFNCSPRAITTDGWLEVCAFRCISHFKFLSLLGTYTKGEHLDDPKVQRIMTYMRAKTVVIDAPKEKFSVSIDGEIESGKHFEVKMLEKSVNIILPKGYTEESMNKQAK